MPELISQFKTLRNFRHVKFTSVNFSGASFSWCAIRNVVTFSHRSPPSSNASVNSSRLVMPSMMPETSTLFTIWKSEKWVVYSRSRSSNSSERIMLRFFALWTLSDYYDIIMTSLLWHHWLYHMHSFRWCNIASYWMPFYCAYCSSFVLHHIAPYVYLCYAFP